MDVLDKVKVAAGQATTKAQEGVATLQTKRKLTHAYGELGQTTYELVQSGELTHPRLSPTVERIGAIKEELERGNRTDGPPSPASAPATRINRMNIMARDTRVEVHAVRPPCDSECGHGRLPSRTRSGSRVAGLRGGLLASPPCAQKPAKNSLMSCASKSGASAGAKWPPRGIGVQRRTS